MTMIEQRGEFMTDVTYPQDQRRPFPDDWGKDLGVKPTDPTTLKRGYGAFVTQAMGMSQGELSAYRLLAEQVLAGEKQMPGVTVEPARNPVAQSKPTEPPIPVAGA